MYVEQEARQESEGDREKERHFLISGFSGWTTSIPITSYIHSPSLVFMFCSYHCAPGDSPVVYVCALCVRVLIKVMNPLKAPLPLSSYFFKV